jgi:hypothetical protein
MKLNRNPSVLICEFLHVDGTNLRVLGMIPEDRTRCSRQQVMKMLWTRLP